MKKWLSCLMLYIFITSVTGVVWAESKTQIPALVKIWEINEDGEILGLTNNGLYVKIKSKLYCLELKTGLKLWAFDLESLEWMGSSAIETIVFRNNLIYFIANYPSFLPMHGHIIALDQKDSRKLWEFKAKAFDDKITFWQDLIYLKENASPCLYAIDLNSGKLRWMKKFESRGWCSAFPKKIEETLFFGTEEALYALDPKTGKEKWRKTIKLEESLLIPKDEMIYFDNRTYIGCSVKGFNVKELQEVWEKPYNNKSGVYFTLDKDLIFIPKESEVLAVLAKTGQIKWQFLGGSIFGPLSYIDNTVLVSTKTNDFLSKIFALDAETGKKKWEFTLPETLTWVIFNNIITQDKKIYLLPVAKSALASAIFILDAETGQVLNKYYTKEVLTNHYVDPKTGWIYLKGSSKLFTLAPLGYLPYLSLRKTGRLLGEKNKIEYKIYYENETNKEVENIVIKDKLPKGVSLVQAEGDFFYDAENNEIIWRLPKLLARGGEKSLSLTVELESFLRGTIVENKVEITAKGLLPNSTSCQIQIP